MKLLKIIYLFILLSTIFASCQKDTKEVQKDDPNFMTYMKYKEHNNNLFNIKNGNSDSKLKSLSYNLKDDNPLQEIRTYVKTEGGYSGIYTFDHIVSDEVMTNINEYPSSNNLPSINYNFDNGTSKEVSNAYNELSNQDAIIDYPSNLPFEIKEQLKRINENIKDLGLQVLKESSYNGKEPAEGDMKIFNSLKFGLDEQANSLYKTINSSNEIDFYTKQSLLYQALSIKDNFSSEAQSAALQGYSSYANSDNITVSSVYASPIKVLGLGSFLKKVVKVVAKLVVIAVATVVAMAIVSLSGDLGTAMFPKNVEGHDGVVVAGAGGALYTMYLIVNKGFKWIDAW